MLKVAKCFSLSLSIFSYSPVSMRMVNTDPSLSDVCHLNLILQTNVNKHWHARASFPWTSSSSLSATPPPPWEGLRTLSSSCGSYTLCLLPAASPCFLPPQNQSQVFSSQSSGCLAAGMEGWSGQKWEKATLVGMKRMLILCFLLGLASCRLCVLVTVSLLHELSNNKARE